MKSETVTKPERIDNDIWQANQQWVQLMSAQASVHRQQRDPRLFRDNHQHSLVSPLPVEIAEKASQ